MAGSGIAAAEAGRGGDGGPRPGVPLAGGCKRTQSQVAAEPEHEAATSGALRQHSCRIEGFAAMELGGDLVLGFGAAEAGHAPLWDPATGTTMATFASQPVLPRGEAAAACESLAVWAAIWGVRGRLAPLAPVQARPAEARRAGRGCNRVKQRPPWPARSRPRGIETPARLASLSARCLGFHSLCSSASLRPRVPPQPWPSCPRRPRTSVCCVRPLTSLAARLASPSS